MSGDDHTVWRRPSPLAIFFFLGRIARGIARNAVQSFAPLVAYVVAAGGSAVANAVVALIFGLAAVVVTAVLRYLVFRYSIGGSSILVRDGVFRRTRLDISLDRIQAVNTEQNLLYRPFGLVNLRLDTAGSSQQEGYLPAVPAELAREIDHRLEGIASATQPAGASEDGNKSDEPETAGGKTLLRYKTGDLVRIGLTNNRTLFFIAVLAPVIEPMLENYVGDLRPEELSGSAPPSAAVAAVLAALVTGLVVLMILASIGAAILRYHAFRLSEDDRSFRTESGFFTRHQHAVRFTKIQALYLYQGILQRLFGVYRLSIRQASSGREAARSSFLLPLVRRADVDTLLRPSFGDEFRDALIEPWAEVYTRVSPHYVASNAVTRGVLPAVLLFALLLPPIGAQGAIALAWIPLSGIYFACRYRRLGVRIRADGLSLRSGFPGVRVVAHLYRKVQRVSVTQSVFQRRRGLATLRLYLASGVITVPFVGHADAQRLRDFILWRAESDDRAWL